MSRNAASEMQVRAAEPTASTWLSANAGSGKTRVLTDRVARLLLAGVSPQHILCLTYTKAAASEMQNRLFRRLGEWSMKPDRELTQALEELGAEGRLDAALLSKARRLFARAIETPGGLKIQTIHSFCASLLRRFPLEAGISPQFAEMEDRAARLLRDDIVEELAAMHPEVLAEVARNYSGEDFTRLTDEVVRHGEYFRAAPDLDAIWATLGLTPGFDDQDVVQVCFDGSEAELLARVLPVLAQQSTTMVQLGQSLAALDFSNPGQRELKELSRLFLYSDRPEPKFASVPTKKAAEALGDDCDALHDFMTRAARARQLEYSLLAARQSVALHRFATLFLEAYEQRKLRRGLLDFDDLIQKARQLLTDPEVAAWVLYRLDGGLEHILVDEAQDTSPTQWRVVELLAQEFFAGEGAKSSQERTLFVVGDQKQSIYSFQGADAEAFDKMRDYFGQRLKRVGQSLRRLVLEYSFRSSPSILRLVDMTLEPLAESGLGGEVLHRAFHDEMPGRVDLWPVVEATNTEITGEWYDPVDRVSDQHHDVILASRIADEIGRLIREKETVPAEKGGFRQIAAGDFLVLVQRRSDLFQEIIRACKARGLPIAGADRLKLGAELAVKDLAALLRFLATPEDSLSLAAALKSPLFGWTEAELYDLAHGRGERYLWNALRDRAEEFPETLEVLGDLRQQADFLRPYELLERILTRHGRRDRLLARLGPEAEDGIDALLAQALAYERSEVPSLTGLITWLETDDVEIKRQLDSAGDRIRVMTVHGAKGLEAPIVILPDTRKRALQVREELVPLDGRIVVWKTSANRMAPQISTSVARLKARQEEENLRLLYVAMTRAEKWLIVCGSGDVGEGAASWYNLAEAGMREVAR